MTILDRSITIKPHNQTGAALITSLLILLLLTIIGLGSMRATTLEEKMAGNNRNRELAFQAAEAALAVGENKVLELFDTVYSGQKVPAYLNTNSATHSCDAASLDTAIKGTCGPHGAMLDPFKANWDRALSVTEGLEAHDSGSDTTLVDPKYFIELVRQNGADYIFRVTAKGFGGDTNAVVILQSTVILDIP